MTSQLHVFCVSTLVHALVEGTTPSMRSNCVALSLAEIRLSNPYGWIWLQGPAGAAGLTAGQEAGPQQ